MIEKEQSAPPGVVSGELEDLCAAVPRMAARAGQGLEERYYVRLAEESLEHCGKKADLRPEAKALEGEVQRELDSLRRSARHLAQAYQSLALTEDELSARLRDMHKSRDRRWYAPNPPANAAIDLKEAKLGHFAQGVGLYKILLICFVGSFCGVVIEMLWCILKYGRVESRAGLVYGPFNLLYGAGAALLSLALYKYRNRGFLWSFTGGFVVGSVLEYVCSWAQEALLGSRSWDYTGMPLNLNGRICLVYSVFWGVLGVLWIKDLYPRMAKWILKIPNRVGKPLTWALTAFLIFNAVVSCVAVGRWAARVAGDPASGPFWEFIDQRFTDQRMRRIFANMTFGE